MALTYDAAALKKIADQLKKISDAPAKVTEAVAGRFRGLLAHQFAEGTDPEGKPWKPLGPATLRKHGPPAFSGSAMVREAEVKVHGTRVVMTVPSPAEYQQGDRPILPPNSHALPEPYAAAVDAAVEAVLEPLEKS